MKFLLERVITNYPKSVIMAFILITAISITQLPRLKQDTDPWLLPKTHESRVNWDRFKDNYTGSRDGVYILIETEDTVFKSHILKSIKTITEEIENIRLFDSNDANRLNGIAENLRGESQIRMNEILSQEVENISWDQLESVRFLMEESKQSTKESNEVFKAVLDRLSPINEVTSLSNTDNILGINDELIVKPIFEEVPETTKELLRMKQLVAENELLHEILYMEDGKSTAIIVEPSLKEDDSVNQQLLFEKIKHILNTNATGDEKIYLAGIPIVSSTMSQTMEADSNRLFPIVLVLVIVSLFLSFRSIQGIIVPVLVVIFSLIITMALKASFGIPLNIVTTALPVFILSIGVADGIHIFSEYRDHLIGGLDKLDAIKRTLQELALPVTMTSITTASAFLSLSITEIVQIRHFGVFVAIGSIIAMFFSLGFIPALLMLLPSSKWITKKNKFKIDQKYQTVLEKISVFSTLNPIPLLTAFVIVATVAVWGATKVKVENNTVQYFKKDSELVIGTNKVNEVAAGSQSLNILISSNEESENAFKNPINLKAIDELSTYLETHALVGKVFGLPDLIKRINLVLHNSDKSYYRLPNKTELIQNSTTESNDGPYTTSGEQLISQLLLLYENAGGDILSDVVLSDYSETNLVVFIKTNSSSELTDLMEDVDAWMAKNFPRNLNYKYTGSVSVMRDTTDQIVVGQMYSFIISLFLTLLFLIFTFKSISLGILGIIPLSTTTLINFGVMGLFNVPLDVGSAIVSSIVIGVGVDNSIHYINRLKLNSNRGLSFENAIRKTSRFCGKAITSNAITVSVGFFALLFSILSPLFTMGWMIIMTMLISAFCTIAMLPAFFSLFRKKIAVNSNSVADLNAIPSKVMNQ